MTSFFDATAAIVVLVLALAANEALAQGPFSFSHTIDGKPVECLQDSENDYKGRRHAHCVSQSNEWYHCVDLGERGLFCLNLDVQRTTLKGGQHG